MNLIEKLGIEKCQAIVDGAPVGTTDYSTEDCVIAYYQKTNNVIFWDFERGIWDEVYFMMPELKSLSDLRTEIADYDNHWYGRSEAEEIKAYAELSQEKIQGGAVLVGNFTVIQQQLQSEINNCSEKDSSEISITDHCTDNLSHLTDNCTDIRNHISPNTKVIER